MGTVDRVTTGVSGFDQIVGGGLPANATYLLKGAAGTGKTTFGLQYLVEGARRGEKCLHVCLAETRGQVLGIAEAYGMKLEGIDIREMRRGGEPGAGPGGYTVFSPAEVELEEISRELLQLLDQNKPYRMVLDSLSEIRMLAEDPGRYRHELLNLFDQIVSRRCTALVIDVEDAGGDVTVAETLAGGVIQLEQLAPAYGGDRRRMRVTKLRASKSIGGYHDFAIGERGLEVFPRLVAAPHRTSHSSAAVPSGLPELDALLGGGLDGGTSTVLMGPAGTGKSTMAAHFATAVATRGERAAMFCFDESPTNLLLRLSGLGIPLARHVESGKAHVVGIDPAEFSPGELSHRIRLQVDEGARVVVLDSMNGYLNSLPEERFLAAHLHELLAFLSEKGVATILTLSQHGLFGATSVPVDISYVADTVVLFRYFEVAGEVKQAVSVVKKRTGNHERSIREIQFSRNGLRIGPPLTRFQGILAGSSVELHDADSRGNGARPDR